MATLTATESPVFVDVSLGETSKRAAIHYDKVPAEQLWEMSPSGVWSELDVLSGTDGTLASVPLSPGSSYHVCICAPGHGPLSGQFRPEASLIIFCLLKKPSELALVKEVLLDFGGTWCRYTFPTSVPTYIVDIGVSRQPLFIDGGGIPRSDPKSLDGSLTKPPNVSSFLAPPVASSVYDIEIEPLLPGNQYFFYVLLTDTTGKWEARHARVFPFSFTTLRRQLSVDFPLIHIFNDGDWATTGEVDVKIGIQGGALFRKTIAFFRWAHVGIDDWSETDRPYVLLDDSGNPFTHVGKPEKLSFEGIGTLQALQVRVWSGGVEDDVFSDDTAGSEVGAGLLAASAARSELPLPVGRQKESVSNQAFQLDCRGQDSFHYGVDVVWSVTYVP